MTRRNAGAASETPSPSAHAVDASTPESGTPGRTPPHPGGRLGPYRLERLLGFGGSAQVWEAQVVERGAPWPPGTNVAVKVLHPHLLFDADARSRLLAEASAVRRLRHRGIVRLRDVVVTDDPDGSPVEAALVFDFVAGGSLAALLDRSGPLPARRAATLAAQIAAALEYAHRHGVVHRDVSPGNVLLDDHGNAMLADFGIARLAESAAAPTVTGSVVGTLRYMAPEQLAGKRVDGRADVYSLGAVLYEMLAGRAAFGARTPIGLVEQQASGPPPLPEAVPAALAGVVAATLQPDPAARPPRAGDVAAALRGWLRGRPIPAAWMTPAAAPAISAAGSEAAAASAVRPERRGVVRPGAAIGLADVESVRRRPPGLARRSFNRPSATVALGVVAALALGVAVLAATAGGSEQPGGPPIAGASSTASPVVRQSVAPRIVSPSPSRPSTGVARNPGAATTSVAGARPAGGAPPGRSKGGPPHGHGHGGDGGIGGSDGGPGGND